MKALRRSLIGFASLFFTLCLAGAVSARPRPPLPPLPDRARLALWAFNDPNSFTNGAAVPVGHVELVESWSGYALRMAGQKPARLQYPELDASGKLNFAAQKGSLMFWFRPDWTSSSLGGTGPGSRACLIEMQTLQKPGLDCRGLLVSSDGNHLAFTVGEKPDAALETEIEWCAGEWHLLALVWEAEKSALFLDGGLVGEWKGSVWLETSDQTASRWFSLGSDGHGEDRAQGEFDELATFARVLDAEWVAGRYRALKALVDKGPVTAEEDRARSERIAQLRAAEPMRLLSVPDNGAFSALMSGLAGLALLPPRVTASNVTLTIVGGEAGARYDLFVISQLGISNQWTFLTRTAPDQTNIVLLASGCTNNFFILGTMQDTDADTLTDAHERLVSKTSPTSYDTTNSVNPTNPAYALLIEQEAEAYLRSKNAIETWTA